MGLDKEDLISKYEIPIFKSEKNLDVIDVKIKPLNLDLKVSNTCLRVSERGVILLLNLQES